jgi:hypothetical protein
MSCRQDVEEKRYSSKENLLLLLKETKHLNDIEHQN